MKKFVLFFFIELLLSVSTAWAKPVDSEVALRVAEHFMIRQRGGEGVKMELRMLDGAYLCQDPQGGFVLVAADDVVRPILAYSLTGRFCDTLPEHVASWLQGYAEEIAWLHSQGVVASPMVKAEWDAFANGDVPHYSTVVAPMLTTTWKQGSPFNTLCPHDSLGNDTKAGCVAIALSQVMKYWNHPVQGVGSYSYTHSTYGTQSANFGATTYDWANMPNALTSTSAATQVNAVATLVYHVGVSVKMKYGHSSSSATTTGSNDLNGINGECALRTYFKYDKALHTVVREVVGDSVWKALLDEELLAARPVIFSGRDTSSGHAFVCDGSDNGGLYHFNWGWAGYCDGYYQIGALNPAPGGTGGNATSHYNLKNKMIIGIQPDTVQGGTHQIVVTASDASMGSVSGGGSYAYGDTIALTASAASGYRFNHWSDGMVYNPRNLIVGGDRSLTAVYEPISGDTLRYDNGFNVNGWGYSTARPFYWGVKFEPSVLAGHALMEAVMVYLCEGTFRVSVYNGATPSASTLVDTMDVSHSGNDGWRTVPLNAAYPVDATQPLWIVLYNDDVTYPAQASTYCGNALAAYGNTSGTSWGTSSQLRTFMIRGIFSTPAIQYQLSATAQHAEDGTVSGSGSYQMGSVATLVATPADCRRFLRWSDGNSSNPRQVTVQSDTAFVALFDTVTYHTIQTLQACDSLTWIDGQTYYASITGPVDTLASVEGCDSVVTLALSLGHSSTDTLRVDTTGVYTWEGQTYSESGAYSHSYQTAEGCDSILVLVLNIVNDTTGIAVPADCGLGLYPNPTTGIVRVEGGEVACIEVYDAAGRLCAHVCNSDTADLTALPVGSYLLRVRFADGSSASAHVLKQ